MSKKKNDHIILLLNERRIMGKTAHDDFFEYVQLSHSKHFGDETKQEYEIFEKFIKSLKGLTRFERLKVRRDIAFLSAANRDGIVFVDWDRFFALSQNILISAAEEAAKLITDKHPKLKKEWDESLMKHEDELTKY